MKTVARIATAIEEVLSSVIGLALRTSIAVLAFVLRRGKHRDWRRQAQRRSEESRP